MLGDRASLLVRVNMLTEVKVLKLFHSKLGQLLKPFKSFIMDWGPSHIKTKGDLKLWDKF